MFGDLFADFVGKSSITDWLIAIGTVGWFLVRLGEWKHAREQPRHSTPTPKDPKLRCATIQDLEIRSLKDQQESRHFCRNLVQIEWLKVASRESVESLKEKVDLLEKRMLGI